MWISNTCAQDCAEENGFKRKEEEFMAALSFLFQNAKCWITLKKSLFTLRYKDTIHKQPSESSSFAELNRCYQSLVRHVSVFEHISP